MKRKKMKNYNFEEKIHKDKAHIYQYLLGNILVLVLVLVLEREMIVIETASS